VRRSAYKRGSIPRAVAMPSFSPHALRPSTFRALNGAYWHHLALAVIGGAWPRGDRRSSAIARLQGFSSCSPAAFPHQWSVWWGEASRAAASTPPSASRIFVIRAKAEEHTEGGLPPRGSVTLFFPQLLGEKGILQPCGGRRTVLPGGGAAFRPPPGRRSCRAWAGHAQVLLTPSAAPGGRSTRRTPRGRYSCSGMASARTGVRTYRCALGRPLFADTVLVGLIPRTAPSDSSALTACPRPSCGDVGEGLFTAASALRSSLLLFSRPRWRSLSLLLQRSPASRLEFVIPWAPWCGGCSYPREWNQSPVCKGIYWVFA
jgi:hypothetical protein